MSSVVLRTDASPEIGIGHLARCLALGEALLECGARSILATRTRSPALLARALGVLERVERVPDSAEADADETIRIARACRAAWIVLDGYHFDAAYRERLQAGGVPVLCVDDAGVERYTCEVVVNGNLYGEDLRYSPSERTRILAGPDYALLRREFRAPGPPRTPDTSGPRILVTLGGSDPGDHVATLLEALSGVLRGGEAVRVIVGPAADPDIARRAIAALPARAAVVHAAEQMAPHMRWADRCITAAGSICLEYARMGVPMAAGIVADNQVPVARSVETHGLGIDLGWLARAPRHASNAPASAGLTDKLAAWFADQAGRRRQARAGPALVDGAGALRIATHMLESLGRAAHA